MNNEAETRGGGLKPLCPGTRNKWLWNIWNSKKLEPEYGDCPECGKKGIEFSVWRLGDGTIKKYKNCPDCSAKYEAEKTMQEQAIKQLEVAKERKQRRESCGISPKFMNEDFSTFKEGWQDKAFKECWDYSELFLVDQRPHGYPSLYLWSSDSWGTGKTHLASAICHRILDRWTDKESKDSPSIIFLSEPELFRRIQATYSFTREERQIRESEDDIIKKIIGADLVVLDDVGKEPRRDMQYVRKILFDLINGRYDQHLPIVITANLDPTGLRGHLENASFDRLWEMTGGKSIRMDGKSYRRKL